MILVFFIRREQELHRLEFRGWYYVVTAYLVSDVEDHGLNEVLLIFLLTACYPKPIQYPDSREISE